jgi:hypothetical protein
MRSEVTTNFENVRMLRFPVRICGVAEAQGGETGLPQMSLEQPWGHFSTP